MDQGTNLTKKETETNAKPLPKNETEKNSVKVNHENVRVKDKATKVNNIKESKKQIRDQNMTFESHPNLSRFKKLGKVTSKSNKHRNKAQKIDTESDYETDDTLESGSESLNLSDGPIQFAPDPNKKYADKLKGAVPKIYPQRVWDPEHFPNTNVNSYQVNNWPKNHGGDGGYYHRKTEYGPNHPCRDPSTAISRPKLVEKRSYHISSVGNDGEEMIEENSVTEDGFQIYHSTAYKKKMKRLEKLENEGELESMKRKIVTRFLLTKCKPDMTKKKVEKYILRNFNVDEVFVRKNPMKFPYYSSFIFIINSEDELDIDEELSNFLNVIFYTSDNFSMKFLASNGV